VLQMSTMRNGQPYKHSQNAPEELFKCKHSI